MSGGDHLVRFAVIGAGIGVAVPILTFGLVGFSLVGVIGISVVCALVGMVIGCLASGPPEGEHPP
jgi:hypothetical protein